MLLFVEGCLSEQKIPEIWETREEKSLSAGALKEKYIKEAQRRFLKTPPLVIVNKQTNWPIELSNRVISEWRSKSRTRERILAVQLLDTMIETAAFLKTTKDEKNTPGIEEVSYFENRCKINGKPFKITIIIKKQTLVNRRFAYYYSAKEL
jgi:hypothetical protein